MFSSISGPGPSNPLRQTRTNSPQRQILIESPAPPKSVNPPSFIHPATAQEFRQRLEPVIQQLPLSLIQAFVDQAYQVHVIDSSGLHSLTLEVSDYDLNCLHGDQPDVILAPFHDGGARSQEELEEWLYYLQFFNPELDLAAPAEQEIILPAYAYWYGRRLPVTTINFLRDPRVLLDTELTPTQAGNIAGMVTHGLLPGMTVAANRVLFWDFPFRQNDPLLGWYILHELGHTTDYSLAFRHPQAWRDWHNRLELSFEQDHPWLTAYSATSPHEYFAEGFAAWATPECISTITNPASALAAQRLACSQQQLLQSDPWLFQLIEEAISLLSN